MCWCIVCIFDEGFYHRHPSLPSTLTFLYFLFFIFNGCIPSLPSTLTFLYLVVFIFNGWHHGQHLLEQRHQDRILLPYVCARRNSWCLGQNSVCLFFFFPFFFFSSSSRLLLVFFSFSITCIVCSSLSECFFCCVGCWLCESLTRVPHMSLRFRSPPPHTSTLHRGVCVGEMGPGTARLPSMCCLHCSRRSWV